MRMTTSTPSCAECHGNLGAQTSWNPLGHTGPVTGLLYIYLYLSVNITPTHDRPIYEEVKRIWNEALVP
jgi:hypothetical protein